MAQALRKRLLAALPALVAASLAAAQALPDPTRPPREAQAAPAAQPGAGAPTGLQSVRISGARRSALIDGRPVRVGGKLGEARVARIDETGVTLRKTDGSIEKLKLYPEVTMRPHEPAASVRRRPKKH
ncbi:MAG: hypothetical protein Fur0039_18750 [Rhodocyclaceae bacterium]